MLFDPNQLGHCLVLPGLGADATPRLLGLNVGVDAEPDRQVNAGIELDEGFENLGVGFLVGLVGADILVAELASDADDVAPELLVAVGVCGAVDPLTISDLLTSVSSTSTRTRRSPTSPMVKTGSGVTLELVMLSPVRWCLRRMVPSNGARRKVLA
jgi:hypothetical protein